MAAACPTLEELILAHADGVSLRERLRLLAHLARCAACRAEIRYVETVLAVVRAEDERDDGAWDEESPRPSHAEFLTRLRAQERMLAQRAHASRAWRWVPVAAMVPLVIVALLLSRTHVAVLQADELLRRAVQEEDARPAGTVLKYRLNATQIGAERLGGHSAATLFREASDDVAASDAPGSELPAAWARALAAYPFDWRHPLGVKRFQVWRDAQETRQDEVRRTPDGLLLRTKVAAGDLRVVELLMRADTYHPIRLTFEVDGLGRVDIEELASWVRRESTPVRPVDADVASARPNAAEVLDATELDVRLALHAVGLAPTRALRIVTTVDEVRVEGSVPTARAQAQLLQRLAHTPHATVSVEVRHDGLPRSEPTLGAGMSHWLAGAFVDDRTRSRFVIELNAQLLTLDQRVAALEELSRRYPLAAAARLSPRTRAQLTRLAQSQTEALSLDLLALRHQLTALLGPTTRGVMTAATGADWRQVARRARPHAAALQARLHTVVSQDAAISESGEAGLDAVRHAINALWETVHQTSRAERRASLSASGGTR